MVELLHDYPPHVAAYKASGAVSREEYENIVMTRVNEVAAEFGKINFIVLLETNADNYSVGSVIEYIRISFQHFSKWSRMAIVSDERWLRTFYSGLSILVHGKIKTYPLAEYDAAKEWVSGPFEY